MTQMTLSQAIGTPFPNRLLVQIDTVCHCNCGLVMWASYTGNCHFRELRVFLFFDRLHDNSKGQRTAVTSSQNSCVRPSAVLWKSQSKLPSKTLSSLVPTVWHALTLSLHTALILNGDHRPWGWGVYTKCLVGSVLITPPQRFVLILDAGPTDWTRKWPTVITVLFCGKWRLSVSTMVTPN